jgi:tRNA-2-methylthio-N6-dimethylallyladenosine synthase
MFHTSKTYFIKTFGCQMNTSDSQRIATFLEEQGFLPCEEIKAADLVIFNTCGVKQTAENRAYSLINNLRKTEKASRLKTKDYLPTRQAGKLKAIVMTGCLANRPDVQKRMKGKVDLFTEIKNFPQDFEKIFFCHPELVLGSPSSELGKLKLRIPDQVRNDRLDIMPINKEEISYLSITPKHKNNFEAYVPIMTGCNNFCAYCVVPNARGREVSRPAEEIIAEVKNLVARGYKNIILLGQNVNSYRGAWSVERGALNAKAKEKIVTFPTLLKKINATPGSFWIQFISSHPKDMSAQLIEVMTKCQKVCECIHLPIQAGDDEILRKMNRRYSQKHYLNLIRKIKKAFKQNKPGKLFSISSDIIVGFPSESRKQFLQSASVMEKAKFDMVFFGQFSPRPETAAWKMKDDVSQKEKARREKFLNEILKKTAFENNQEYLGKIVEVLIEQKKNDSYFGKTRTLKNVRIATDKKNLVGQIIKVKITKVNVWNLEARLAK